MHVCYCYSLKWRYEFNNSKSGMVTFGETKAMYYQSMKTREWILGGDTVDELYEYRNLGVLKNYIGSFSSNVDDNIEKTRNKAGMIFSSHLDRRKANPVLGIGSGSSLVSSLCCHFWIYRGWFYYLLTRCKGRTMKY